MNIAQMLMATVTPLSLYVPETHAEKRERREKKKQSESLVDYNNRTSAAFVARVKAIWKPGEEWLSTVEIDRRIGAKHNGAIRKLKRLMNAHSLVERRPVGESFNRSRGYEWRWIK